LLCNPIGAEALQAHRLYRVLAEQLEQAGFTVLRFDYAGTGDSAGGPEAATISGWTNDVATAAGELARTAPGTRLVIVGLRLGATLAALASARSLVRPRQLVLWDPVIDGLGYLRDLARVHREFMKEEMRPLEWQDRLEVDADGIPTESIGMPITAELAGELRHVDLTRELPIADHIAVICTRSNEETTRFRNAVGTRTGHKWIEAADSENWNCDSALNAATVPMGIIREIVNSIQETNP